VIDLHSHILPGLDDGADDFDAALGIARTAVADGITAIAATPHVREDYPTTADAMEGGVRQLRKALEREGIELELLPGGEVSLEQLDRLSHDELRRFALAGNPNYLLVETPYWDWPVPFGEIVARVRSFGMNPVIAHPERNPAIQADLGKVAALVDAGALNREPDQPSAASAPLFVQCFSHCLNDQETQTPNGHGCHGKG